jgi:hypothetical protein
MMATPITHLELDSSSLRSVAYAAETATLELAFRNGSTYRYFEVPLPTYQALVAADSKGRYFTTAIRPSFRFERLR